MSTGRAAVLEAARRLAEELPQSAVEAVATLLEASHAGLLQAAVQSAIAHQHYRAMALDFLRIWRREAPDLAGASVALGLRTAAHCQAFAERTQRLDLVWTGPDVGLAYRHTQPALLDLINRAKTRLTVVSFVVYKVPAVTTAVAEAARRGVDVRIVVEDAEASDGKVAFDALASLGAEVAAHARVFVWPTDKRPTDSAGHYGSLHAKCAISDRDWLLMSSANLTKYAFTLNMELGLLIRGGPLPGRVDDYLTALIENRVLRSITS